MMEGAVTVRADAPLLSALAVLADQNIGACPVLDAAGRFYSMLSIKVREETATARPTTVMKSTP